jgi:ATP-dependent RNA helicase RhlE
MLFKDLALDPSLLQAIEDTGYKTPTPIQAESIPNVLAGKDLMAAAQTGTGKTAGFTLPMIQNLMQGKPASHNQVRALVLTPTRELAAQVADSIKTYGKHTKLRYQVVFGGVKINPQMQELRKGADILIATPGRLLDLYQQNAIKFDQLEILVLDEADRMLDMGFIHDIKRILKLLPASRQNLMFSATFSDEIRELANSLMNNAVEVSVTPKNETAKSVEQTLISLDQPQKMQFLVSLLKTIDSKQAIIFSRTKYGANRIAQRLDKKGFTAAAIHGDKSQGARTKALNGFRDKSIQFLVATDIAARGIDIDDLPWVINFDLPQVAEDYVHRIGRTGRAGSTGNAISFVDAGEFNNLNDIEQLIQQHIPRVTDDEFQPNVELRASKPIKPLKPKKPKKNKAKSDGNGQEQNRSQSEKDSKPKLANKNRPNKSGGRRSNGGKQVEHTKAKQRNNRRQKGKLNG